MNDPAIAPSQAAAAASLVDFVLRCDACGATLRCSGEHRPGACLYCRSPVLVSAAGSVEQPRALVPFVVTRERAIATVRRWTRGRWLSPRWFRAADVAAVRGVYIPVYLASATVHADFSASVRRYESDGQKYSDWAPIAGRWSGYVEEVWVSASSGLSEAEFAALRPFDLAALRRYDAKLLAGWDCEEPGRPRSAYVQQLEKELHANVRARVSAMLVGDDRRRITVRLHKERQSVALVLLPVWVLAAAAGADRPATHVLVNGQSGEIVGVAPRSAVRHALLWTALTLAIAVGGALWMNPRIVLSLFGGSG
jgi:hypothetical protein